MFGEAPADWIEKVYITESLSGDEKIMEKVKSLSEEKAEIVADNIFRQFSRCIAFYTGSDGAISGQHSCVHTTLFFF